MKIKLLSLLTFSALTLGFLSPAHAGGYYGEDNSVMEPEVEMDMDMDSDSGMEIDIESNSSSSSGEYSEEIIYEEKYDYEDRYDMEIRDTEVNEDEKVSVEVEEDSAFGRNYIGGVYKGDDNNFGVIGKFGAVKLSDTASLSLRPAVYFGDRDPELRVPLTLDGKISENLTGYVGGGFEVDFEGDNEYQGLVTGGLDVHLGKFTVGAGLDYLTADNDVQGKAIVGFSF